MTVYTVKAFERDGDLVLAFSSVLSWLIPPCLISHSLLIPMSPALDGRQYTHPYDKSPCSSETPIFAPIAVPLLSGTFFSNTTRRYLLHLPLDRHLDTNDSEHLPKMITRLYEKPHQIVMSSNYQDRQRGRITNQS